MNSTPKILFSLVASALTMVVTACGTTPKPVATTTVANPETSLADGADTPSISCASWQDYPASDPSEQLPTMPPGFETGCVFKVGQTTSVTVQILRNGLSLDAITAPGTATKVATDGPIPWFEATEIASDQLNELIASGDVATYYQNCVTTGGQSTNCDGFDAERAYVINDDTACFQGHCLQVPQVHAIYLLSQWDLEDKVDDFPQSFDPKQTAARNKFSTVPLNTLYSDVSLIGESPEDIAFNAFGRSSLAEGERSTIVNGPTIEDDLSIVDVINEGTADDSIGGYRYRLDFSNYDGDQYQLLWVGKQHYCTRSNPPGWTKELCS